MNVVVSHPIGDEAATAPERQAGDFMPSSMPPGSSGGPSSPPHRPPPRRVDHTYRDFSRYAEDGGELIKHKKSGNNFPARLHQILSDPAHVNIITWMVRWS